MIAMGDDRRARQANSSRRAIMLKSKILRRPLAFAALLALVLAPAVWANDSLNQGLSHFKSGKYAEAAAEFQTLVDGSPGYDYGYFMLGLSLLKMGKFKEADANIVKAIQLNGDKFEYHNGLATVYFTQKNYAKAISALKTAEPLASTDQYKFVLFSMRGNCYAALQKWSDAVDDLEKAKAINSGQASVLVTLGQSYYKLGYFDKAAAVFRLAVKAVPTDTSTTQLLAESLLNLGAEAKSDSEKSSMYKEALIYGEKFQKAKPSSYEASNLVGRAALGAKNYPAAEQAFRKVLAQKPDYCYAMANLGKTYIAQQKWGDAEQILKEAAACAPRMAVVQESLGFSLQKQGRLPDAIQAYERAYEIKPSETVRNAINICQQNIEVAEHNTDVAAKEQAQAQAEAEAQAAYEEEMRKKAEWEERRKKDD
jgi:tetratricopeptide (TPR) repeat protein